MNATNALGLLGRTGPERVTAEHALDLPSLDHDLDRFRQVSVEYDVVPSEAHDLTGPTYLAVTSARGRMLVAYDHRGRPFRLRTVDLT